MKNAANLINIITAEHERKWVALTEDTTRVVAYDQSLIALKNKIGNQKVVFMKVPPSDVYLSF